MKFFTLVLAALLLTGCSSGPTTSAPGVIVCHDPDHIEGA